MRAMFSFCASSSSSSSSGTKDKAAAQAEGKAASPDDEVKAEVPKEEAEKPKVGCCTAQALQAASTPTKTPVEALPVAPAMAAAAATPATATTPVAAVAVAAILTTPAPAAAVATTPSSAQGVLQEFSSVQLYTDFVGALETALLGIKNGLQHDPLACILEEAVNVIVQRALLDAGYTEVRSSNRGAKDVIYWIPKCLKPTSIGSEYCPALPRPGNCKPDVMILRAQRGADDCFQYTMSDFLLVLELKSYPEFGPKAQLASKGFNGDLKKLQENCCHAFVFVSSIKLYISRYDDGDNADLLPKNTEIPANCFTTFRKLWKGQQYLARVTRLSLDPAYIICALWRCPKSLS
eukprot:TRINITY_DN346_c3_g1_i1.p1 TRINITY_DN346_c3_g1~~TRINITY_DN346_c3_g1_i1.p1  ORF type:complete len:376 (-),score=69.18 TRINITY_DN346_c3_g1_i1:30-1079(-)